MRRGVCLSSYTYMRARNQRPAPRTTRPHNQAFIYPSVHPSIHPSIHLSIHPHHPSKHYSRDDPRDGLGGAGVGRGGEAKPQAEAGARGDEGVGLADGLPVDLLGGCGVVLGGLVESWFGGLWNGLCGSRWYIGGGGWMGV